MAGSEVDIGQLTESQQLALQQFTAVTDQELEAAIPLLRRSEWNVQIAITKFFDGETADPVAEALQAASVAPPRPSTRQEVLLNGFTSSSSSSSSSQGFEDAPRVVPQPEGQMTYRPPFVLSILLTPLNLLYRLLSTPFGFFTYLFPFLSRILPGRGPQTSSSRNTTGRRSLNPRDTATRFIREFEEEHGSHPLPFQETSYATALDKAKQDLKFLLVILLSPEHDDTVSFVRSTLLSPEVTSFLTDPSNNIMIWAGSVQDSEPYQVSTALNATKFPFAALIVHTPQRSSTAMSIVARVGGPTPPTAFVAKLQSAISQHAPALERVRNTRAEQQAARNLREEQNSAYERSLAVDRERARQRREAEAARERAEREAREQAEREQRQAEMLQQWKKWRASLLRPEPAQGEQACRISIRLPDGERVVRRFAPDTPLDDLYAFVECYDVLDEKVPRGSAQAPSHFEHKYPFRLVSPMPRQVYDLEAGGSVAEKVGRSANLIVEMIDEEEEEEYDDEGHE